MKKFVFGITLFIGGLLGILTCMLIPAISAQALGVINDDPNMLSYLKWFGLMPYFVCFVFMLITGIIICIKEVCFNNKSTI